MEHAGHVIHILHASFPALQHLCVVTGSTLF